MGKYRKVMTVCAEKLAADAGEDAALAGHPRSSNPYNVIDGALYTWWDAGWLSVCDEEKTDAYIQNLK